MSDVLTCCEGGGTTHDITDDLDTRRRSSGRPSITPAARMRCQRTLLILTIGAIGARIAINEAVVRPRVSDFAQAVAAARFLITGINPYEAIGPHGQFVFAFPFFYPLPAAVVALPVSWLPLDLADGAFMGLGSMALAWALTRHGTRNPQLLVFVSVAFLAALGNAQWSLLMTAAALLPPLGFLLAAKPTLALALLAAYPTRVAMPRLQVLPLGTHFMAPVTVWGGPLILLALLKWRRPEARLLAALACVPHSAVLYEAIPLFLVVQTWTEGAILVLLTPVVWYAQEHVGAPYLTNDAWSVARTQWQVLLVYLPCLLMVLRRPNRPDDCGTLMADASAVSALAPGPQAASASMRVGTQSAG